MRSFFQDTPPGNNGYVGFFIDRPEIIPHIPKTGMHVWWRDVPVVPLFLIPRLVPFLSFFP